MEAPMLTYLLEKKTGVSLYEQLYRCIKEDILSGRLTSGEKLPSKRTLAQHLEISVITVKNAYEQLCAEGYLYGVEKRGYYVGRVEIPPAPCRENAGRIPTEKPPAYWMDFVTNSIAAEDFPFTVWAKIMRETILEQDKQLLAPLAYNGTQELRGAIARYLLQFRAMQVDAEQIVIGAGTEVLYPLLIQLLGRDRCYAVEDPGYRKIGAIYESNQVPLCRVGLDENGLSVEQLRRSGADVVHLSPSHHYPTGIVMPIGRRQELLQWAGDTGYILEDDYDSEFRFVGKPIQTLYSIDRNERVIYLNTFSKTIAPSIRISYMILPPHLLRRYREKLGLYACTVSSFEQYTLARFMERGRYEQHINRMRNRYHQKRDALIEAIRKSECTGRVKILEQDAGLHFLMRIDTDCPDEVLRRRAAAQGIRLALLSDYYADPQQAPQHILVVNYSGIETDRLQEALHRLAAIFWEEST
jgi:GntR family transcriptional regulator/MocR family aminotransferase